MPLRDFLPRPPRADSLGRPFTRRPHLRTLALLAMLARRRKGKDRDQGGVPVEPNRPNTLTGGAAAALEFDD